MTQSYKQPGHNLTLTAPYARASSGLGMKVGAIFGVTCDAIANGAAGQVETEGVHSLAKIGSQAWTVGTRVFWDDTNKRLTSVATDGMFVGVAVEAVGSGAGETTGVIKLAGLQVLAEGLQAALTDLTAGTDITAATANGVLVDSSAVNPTKAQFDELAKELMTKINAINAVLRAAGIAA